MDVDGHPPATQGGGEGGGEGKEGKEHAQHPPAKRYRMTDHMKAIVWELVLLSNECCRLENEKKWVLFSFLFLFGRSRGMCADCFVAFSSTLEGSVIQLSDQGLRKVLYQKVRPCLPFCSFFCFVLFLFFIRVGLWDLLDRSYVSGRMDVLWSNIKRWYACLLSWFSNFFLL